MDAQQQRAAELTKKTATAIAANGQPPMVNNKLPAEVPRPQVQQPSRPKASSKDEDQMSRRMCRMFFPSSGRMGFDMIKDSDELPSIEIVRDMIAYETRLRLSEPIQELMDLYYKDEDSVT